MRTRIGSDFSKYLLLFSINCLILLVYIPTMAQSTSGEKPKSSGVNTAQQMQGDSLKIPEDEASIAHGRDLFGQHCTACHQVKQQVIGPALASVEQRRPLPWLLMFIKNSQQVITTQKDEYAQQLFEQYNKQVMPPFEFLSNNDIVSILSYIKSESSTAVGAGVNGMDNAANKTSKDEASTDAYAQKSGDQRDDENAAEPATGISGGLVFAILGGMLVLIGIIFAVARNSTKGARKAKQ